MILASVQASMWSGPTPHPDELAKYNGVIDGGADRVMSMIEGQASHRQDIERRGQDSDIWLRKVGLVGGLLLSAIAIIGGMLLIADGKNIGALGPLIAGLAVLAGVFVWWRKGDDTPKQIGPPPAQPPQPADKAADQPS
jgi:uncharacterized membrane protein